MYWCNFFKRLGIFLFSLLWLNKALIVFGIFCTLIKYKKANVKKKSKIVCMVIFYKTRIGTRLFGSLITWWFILFIYRQTIMLVHDEGNNFGYIMDFFFLVIILMKRENGTRTWSIYQIRCDEAWNLLSMETHLAPWLMDEKFREFLMTI